MSKPLLVTLASAACLAAVGCEVILPAPDADKLQALWSDGDKNSNRQQHARLWWDLNAVVLLAGKQIEGVLLALQ